MIIGNYDGDPNDFIELTAKDEGHHQCKRFFCHFCLRGSYDTEIDNVKDKIDWACPYCQGQCFCSRCTRNDKLLKLIAFYASFGGDINLLYDNLVTRNKILDFLNSYMVLSKILIINNNTSISPAQIVKKAKNKSKTNLNDMDILIDKFEQYKSQLEEVLDYYNNLFTKARIDKCLLYINNKLHQNFDDFKNDEHLLNKKRKNYLLKNNSFAIKKKSKVPAKRKKK